jgi:hypothetical protein
VRAADLLGDESLAYQARLTLIDAATGAGYLDRALVAFAWCRTYAKAHPDAVDWFTLVWKYTPLGLLT